MSAMASDTQESRRPSRTRSQPALIFFGVLIFYFIIGILTIDRGYIDFGDGNYLYISWRLSQGAKLYEDIVSPQPPLHLLTGRVLVGIGESLGGGMVTLAIVRVFSLLLRMLTAWLVYRIAAILFEDGWVSMLAGIVFLFLPLGFFWSKGFQSEPLEILFLTWAFYGLIEGSRRGTAYAALGSVLALFTNMTAVPYVALFAVFYLFCRRRHALRYFGVLVPVGGALLAWFQWSTGGAYIQNVFFNQVGTFPRERLFEYVVGKIMSQGGGILIAEGGFVLCAALGAIVYLSQEYLDIRKVALWYFYWGLGSIAFVSKGGTEDYIFSLAEPMVAVFSAFFLRFFYLGTFSAWMTETGMGTLSMRLTKGAALLTLFLVLCVRSGWEILETLSENKYENTSRRVVGLVDYIQRQSEPDDLVWAPPYYAFAARRKIPEDASSTFIWYVRYMHHKLYGDPDTEVLQLVDDIVAKLDGEQTPVVLLNSRAGQLGSIPEIQQAVRRNYTLIEDNIPSRNEDLSLHVSRSRVVPLDLGFTP